MADRVVGLDVGSRAVRVADIEPGSPPVLRVFGQVSLPPGAVVGGEVVDGGLVADAIRRLWREAELRSRSVRVGVASERVVVRNIELPDLPDAELAGALQFEAQNYVPIPVDETVLDFHVLERTAGVDGEAVARLLLAAAHRETVDQLIGAVKAAGVTPVAVDLLPLALIRALRPAAEETGGAEAIVSVGAGLTTIAVHEAGTPRLVRMVATGGDAVTEAVSRQLRVDADAAEAAKRAAGRDGDAAVLGAVEDALPSITGPIHNSLDYYMSQTESPPLTRVVLTGGGALTPGLDELLASSLGLPVDHARLRDTVDVGESGIPEEELAEVEPYLPAAVGLASTVVRGRGIEIDLLPAGARREAAARRAARRLTLAGGVVLLVLAALSLLQAVSAAGERDRLAEQRRANEALRARVDELAEPLRVEQELAVARQALTAALAGDISWARVLEDLAATIPETVWLDSFGLQRTGGPAAAGNPGADAVTAAGTGTEATGGAAGGPMGSASFTGTALDFPSVAAWLDRLPRIPYYLDLFVSSANKVEGEPRDVVSFTSGANVGPAVRSDRLRRILEDEP